MNTDVAIVGGSFAGLSAALQLARARRDVTVIDAGEPRNRFAKTSHGLLGWDGAKPADILAEARRQLEAYSTVRFLKGRAVDASGKADEFTISCDDGSSLLARRIVLTHGVVDSLPDIPGLEAEWGLRVAHCPYCHGYEFGGGSLGVLAANAEMAFHQAMLVREWGPVTLFLNGASEPSPEILQQFESRGVAVEREEVEAVASRPEGLALRLADGRIVEVAGLFTQPSSRLSSDIGARLGCAHTEGPFGRILSVDDWKHTSVAGIFAAGDIARPAPSVPLAVADGALAGVAAHRSLVFP